MRFRTFHTEATMPLEFELELGGTYIPGEAPTGPSYSSGGEPGHEPYIEDAEVTGLFLEVLSRDRYGSPVYRDGPEPIYFRRQYDRVDVLAQVSPEARAEVLAALTRIISNEAEATLLQETEEAA